ncbi:MAG TPA: type II toxin-antitoxin system VapC family toxin [Gaiellaceae bacterium]|nr:type II toxin-antitoxin system VapC family toxin [Gaiellaceae bacterium]
MIVVDTTVLVYAVGEEHELTEPSRLLVEAIADGRVAATTTAEVIQEFVHVRARRRGRSDAVRVGRAYAELLGPLVAVERGALEQGLRLFERLPALGAFDSVLAAAALESRASGLVSADRAFASVPRLRFVEIGSPALHELISTG